MNNTLYTQLVHMVTIAALAALVAIGKLDVQTGISGIALLVGIAIPSPFSVAGGGPAPSEPQEKPSTPATPAAPAPAASQ